MGLESIPVRGRTLLGLPSLRLRLSVRGVPAVLGARGCPFPWGALPRLSHTELVAEAAAARCISQPSAARTGVCDSPWGEGWPHHVPASLEPACRLY